MKDTEERQCFLPWSKKSTPIFSQFYHSSWTTPTTFKSINYSTDLLKIYFLSYKTIVFHSFRWHQVLAKILLHVLIFSQGIHLAILTKDSNLRRLERHYIQSLVRRIFPCKERISFFNMENGEKKLVILPTTTSAWLVDTQPSSPSCRETFLVFILAHTLRKETSLVALE